MFCRQQYVNTGDLPPQRIVHHYPSPILKRKRKKGGFQTTRGDTQTRLIVQQKPRTRKNGGTVVSNTRRRRHPVAGSAPLSEAWLKSGSRRDIFPLPQSPPCFAVVSPVSDVPRLPAPPVVVSAAHTHTSAHREKKEKKEDQLPSHRRLFFLGDYVYVESQADTL